MDEKSKSKSLCKRSVTSKKYNSCESLHCEYRKIKNKVEHWVAVIVNNTGNVLYFDSYGVPPLETEGINFLNNHSSSWR